MLYIYLGIYSETFPYIVTCIRYYVGGRLSMAIHCVSHNYPENGITAQAVGFLRHM